MEYGLIGEKLPHSFSKEIHEKLGYYQYSLEELKREELKGFFLQQNFKGINVTIPYK
ncbi:MAG: shikimate dehydrogenase, partial [Ruminococcus sp.]|nr:shikimate dehydrogenase [Ruminococcus sp.]